jgi:hypothetical protein
MEKKKMKMMEINCEADKSKQRLNCSKAEREPKRYKNRNKA